MSTAQEIWAKWDPAQHETEYAQKRIKSAQSAKLTPISIDRDEMCGHFQGSYGSYDTWLTECQCVDFARSQKPCKHIYRLAMELGVYSATFSTNKNAIPVQGSQKKIPLEYTVELIDKLPVSAQEVLYDVVFRSTREQPEYWIERNSDYTALIESDLVRECVHDPADRRFAFGKVNDLKRELKSRGLEYDKSLKKEPLCKFCTEHYPDEMAKIYPELFPVMINPDFSRTHIHNYLSQKSTERYWAEHKDEYVEDNMPSEYADRPKNEDVSFNWQRLDDQEEQKPPVQKPSLVNRIRSFFT